MRTKVYTVKITRIVKSDRDKEGRDIVIAGKRVSKIAIKTDRFDNDWLEGIAWKSDDKILDLREGDEVKISVSEREYNGKIYKNFKLPSKVDQEISEIWDAIDQLRGDVPSNKTQPGPAEPEITDDDIPF